MLAVLAAFPSVSLNAAVGSPYTRCSGATGLVPADVWEEVREIQRIDTVGRCIGMLVDPRSDSLESLHGVLEDHVLKDFDGAVFDCVFGVISLILMTLHLVEINHGLARARELLATADGLFNKYGDLLNDSEWPVDPDDYHVQHTLLGFEPRDCAGSSLRIYIYNTTGDLTRDRLRTGFGMMAAATHVHAYLEHSTCLTQNPEEADLFFIPAYHGKQYVEMLERASHKEVAEELFPYLARRRGVDHFFVVGANLPSWPQLNPLRHASQLTVESYQVNDEIPRWYSPWKDIMIPGYIDRWRIAAMRAVNKPTHERGFILAFHGNHPGTHHLYVKFNARVRTKILDAFTGIPDCSVGGHTPEFFERMGRSHFCLVPRGSSAWTIHLYESFFFGCVPVILSDELEVPFQGIVNWPSFSLKWPEDRVGPELLERLRSIPLDRIATMKSNLEAAACWFDFHAGRGNTPRDEDGGWSLKLSNAVALSRDCPYRGHGDASTARACRQSCEDLSSCNLVNYRPPESVGDGGRSLDNVMSGDCVLRACSDPTQPTLTGGALGYEVWAKVGQAHGCSPFAALIRGLESRTKSLPFSYGAHWP